MPQSNARDNLISLGRFNSPTEGAIALARLEEEGIPAQLGSDATATWLNYVGADLIGVELFVRQGDGPRAQEILNEVFERQEHQRESADDLDDSIDDDDIEDQPTPPMVRAFRASIIGCILLPPLVNCYSCWLIVRHRLWNTDDDWRYYGALAFNFLGFFVAWWLWLAG